MNIIIQNNCCSVVCSSLSSQLLSMLSQTFLFWIMFLAVLLQLNHLRSVIGRRRRRLLSFRRQQVVQRIVLVQLLVNSVTVPRTRRQWVRDRSGHWWQQVVSSFTPHERLENFRLSKTTFDYLCDQLRPSF